MTPSPTVERLRLAIEGEQEALARHRVKPWAPMDRQAQETANHWVLMILLGLGLVAFGLGLAGKLDMFIDPSSLDTLGRKAFSRMVVGGLAAIGVFLSGVMVCYVTGGMIWSWIESWRGMSLDETQAQEISAYCQEEPWAKQVVVDWLAGTSHQLLGTREYHSLGKRRANIAQLRKKIQEHQAVADILNEAQLVDQAQAEHTRRTLDSNTPSAVATPSPQRL